MIADHEVSGVSTCLFDLLRAGDTLVVRWVDRLGRDYRHVSDTIRAFMRSGVIRRRPRP